MYCRKCGAEVVDGSYFCSACGQELQLPVMSQNKENKNNKSNKKRVRIIAAISVVLVLVLSTLGIVSFLSGNEDALVRKIQSIETSCLNRDYDTAKEYADNLPTKYRQYFSEYIRYAEEIDSFSGTCAELIDYLEVCFDAVDGASYIVDCSEDTLLCDYNLDFWDNVEEAYGKLKENKELLIQMIDLNPKLCGVEAECFSEYVSILYDCRDIIYCPPTQSRVEVPNKTIGELDARVAQWYAYYLSEADRIRNEYSSEIVDEYIDSFVEALDTSYKEYKDTISLSNLYDISDDSGILYILIDDAERDYEYIDKLITLTIQKVLQDSMIDNLYKTNFAIVSEGTKEYFYSHNDAAQQVLDIINDVFPGVMPEISDGKGLTISETVNNSVNKAIEERK